MSIDAGTIAACASAFAAVIALGISCWQTCLSNRQSLFARRLDLWIIVEKLVHLYRDNSGELEQGEGPKLAIDLRYVRLTNTTFLQEITLCIAHTLENEYQLRFHLKLDELNSLAIEAPFIFKGKSGEAISGFLNAYRALLFSIYQYKILLDHMLKNAREFGWTSEEAVDKLDEKSQRKELFDAESALKVAYDMLVDAKMVGKIEKQIRLARTLWGALNQSR